MTYRATNEARFLKNEMDPNTPLVFLKIQILKTRSKNWFLRIQNRSNKP
jgi:hypothetical protein